MNSSRRNPSIGIQQVPIHQSSTSNLYWMVFSCLMICGTFKALSLTMNGRGIVSEKATSYFKLIVVQMFQDSHVFCAVKSSAAPSPFVLTHHHLRAHVELLNLAFTQTFMKSDYKGGSLHNQGIQQSNSHVNLLNMMIGILLMFFQQENVFHHNMFFCGNL